MSKDTSIVNRQVRTLVGNGIAAPPQGGASLLFSILPGECFAPSATGGAKKRAPPQSADSQCFPEVRLTPSSLFP